MRLLIFNIYGRSRRKRVVALAGIALGIVGILGLLGPALAQPADTVTYQGATLQPGDVINFLGGGATSGNFLVYGHTGMYIGTDPQTKQKSFLDFSTTKGGPTNLVFGSPQAFGGRILTEGEFLNYNAKYHEAFDVFRLRNNSAINRTLLIREAKQIANTESWGPLGEVCSSAVAVVLSKATGTAIAGRTPDDLTTGVFMRHPQLIGRSINIQAALRDVRRRADCRADVNARAAAGETQFRSCGACSPSEIQDHLARLRVLQDRELQHCDEQ